MKAIADGKSAKAEKQGVTFEAMLEGLETQLHTARTEAEYYANRLEEDLAEQRAKIRASSQEVHHAFRGFAKIMHESMCIGK